MDDIEETKMPEKVKLSIASAGFSKLDTADNEMDFGKERDRGLDILQQLLPDANLHVRSRPVKEFKTVARFDPLCQTSAQLEVKNQPISKPNEPKPKKSQHLEPVIKGKKLQAEPAIAISKGIDKKKAQIEKANAILKKSIDMYAQSSTKPKNTNDKSKTKNGASVPAVAVKRKVVKEIKTQKWKEISSQKAELKEFKLFG